MVDESKPLFYILNFKVQKADTMYMWGVGGEYILESEEDTSRQ